MRSKRKRKTTALPKSKRQKAITIQNILNSRPEPLRKLLPVKDIKKEKGNFKHGETDDLH